MVATTYLHESELNVPTGDPELDPLLQEVRDLSGRDYQAVRGPSAIPLLFRRTRPAKFALYVFVDGLLPWQQISSVTCKQTLEAYLMGVLNGYSHALRNQA